MLQLPLRSGSRPAVYDGIPHRQLDQTPSPDLYARLVSRFLAMPGTTHGPSLISVPGAQALFLPCSQPCSEAGFLRGTEFAHVHPARDGSFHMVLSSEDCDQVLRQCWGELHPWARSGKIGPTVTLVYAPRDDQEIDIALQIAAASYRYAQACATGQVPR